MRWSELCSLGSVITLLLIYFQGQKMALAPTPHWIDENILASESIVMHDFNRSRHSPSLRHSTTEPIPINWAIYWATFTYLLKTPIKKSSRPGFEWTSYVYGLYMVCPTWSFSTHHSCFLSYMSWFIVCGLPATETTHISRRLSAIKGYLQAWSCRLWFVERLLELL